MSKKVIGLLIVIPLLLMLVLFTASTTVSLVTPIFVSNIECENAAVEYVNLSESGGELFAKYTVYPINADNKAVTYEYEAVDGKPLAEISIDENGRITPKKCGTVKVTIRTVDNARTDSFILVVQSDKVIDFSLNLEKEEYIIGDEFSATPVFEPVDAEDTELEWTSTNANVVSVDRYSGRARARSVGTTTLTATLKNGYNGAITRTAEVTVVGRRNESGISFSGDSYVTLSGSGEVLMSVDNSAGGEYTVGFNKTESDFATFEVAETATDIYKISFTLASGIERTTVSARIERGSTHGMFESFEIIKADGVNSVEFATQYTNNALNIKKGTQTTVRVEISPEDAVCEYEWSVSPGGSASILASGNRCAVRGDSEGQCRLTVKVTYGGLLIRTLELDVRVIEQKISNLYITTATPGIEKLLTVPKQVYSGNTLQDNVFNVTYNTEATSDVSEDLIWTIDEGMDFAEIDGGAISVKGDGKIKVTVKSRSAMLLGRNVSSTMSFRVVNGVGVRNYAELKTAAAAGRQIVLLNGIGSAKDVADRNATAEFGRGTTEIQSTGDCQFYLNRDGQIPNVKVGIEFKNNLYGNGFVLNAHNLTYGLDATGTNLRADAIFRGPLDFVSIDGAAVKGQDNIVFLLRDNVTVDNVELKGCDDVTRLEYLNYTGTTVEVIGDNVNIFNSRISNGRTVLRIFGSDDSDEIVNVRVESCILRAAREFIIRIGSNKLLRGDLNGATGQAAYDNCSPKLSANGKTFENAQAQSLYANDADFAAEILRTRLSLKNCSLVNCGIFTIGIDSHFSGPCLDALPVSSGQEPFANWVDCAATSYGVLLKLEGDVKMYDWKKVSSIDSSTLIEGEVLSFDVASIINGVLEKPEYGNMSELYNNEAYVHGGIALFGGGRNYGVVDDRTGAVANNRIIRYNIGLAEAGDIGLLLQHAAGQQRFGFYMYSTSGTNTVAWQQTELISGAAFSWITPAAV